MFRATILSFVLLFAAGPSASLVCKAWCEPSAAARNGCHHDGANVASVATNDSCQDSVQELATVLKEDVRRTSLLDSSLSGALASFQFAALSTSHSVRHRGRAPSDLQRPLNTPLRV